MMELNNDSTIKNLISKNEGLDFIENCPHCNKSVTPALIAKQNYYNESLGLPLETLILRCNRQNCSRIYMVDYSTQSDFLNRREVVVDKMVYPYENDSYHDENIDKISPEFINIYNESQIAENMGLKRICGSGYRKAIEFLVKDYIIYTNNEKEDFDVEEIKQSTRVIKLIERYFDDHVLISVTKKAFWLGNDETHYIRKWESKDINDMKNLIEIILYKIKMDLAMKKYEEEMN